MAKFNLNDYVMVNERIEKFYEKYPEGSIQAEIKTLEDGMVVVKAYAYRDREDAIPATGHAYEKEGQGYVNKTSFIENCETSAVGRALAMLGFDIKKSIASREEMEKVKRMSKDDKKISDTQESIIKSMIADTDTDIEEFCTYYKIDKFGDLTAEQFKKAVAQLNAKKEEK